ncbi:MAG: tripartite tricarboxylate transporter substrate-binding protein, partial [Caldimonas sp.]
WTTAQYKGNAPATNDLLGGQVQFNFDQVSVAQQFVKDGKLRALAVATPKRVPWLPDVPTFEEAGIKGVEALTFTGILAPAGTPGPIVTKLSETVAKILAEPAIVQKFYAAGSEARAMKPAEFAAWLRKEESTWLPVIKSSNITAD